MPLVPSTLRTELIKAAGQNLEDLARELGRLREDIPEIISSIDRRAITVPRLGVLMAIAFEAGRNCGIQQAIEKPLREP